MAGGDVCSSDSFSEDIAVFSKQVNRKRWFMSEAGPAHQGGGFVEKKLKLQQQCG